MAWREEAESALPGRHPREPSTLRQDLLDELTDHLAEAAGRERERGAPDEQTAWKRALEAFGDPAAIARQLWWDAMREHIMRDWIQTALLASIVLVVAGLGAMQYRQFVLMEEFLRVPAAAQPAPLSDWRVLEVHAHHHSEDGPPADIEVQVTGKALGGDETVTLEGRTGEQGIFVSEPIRPGKYHIQLKDPDTELVQGATYIHFPGDVPAEFRRVVPDPEPIALRMSVDCDPALWDLADYFKVRITNSEEDWFPPRFEYVLIRKDSPRTMARVTESDLRINAIRHHSPDMRYFEVTLPPDLESLEWHAELMVHGDSMEVVVVPLFESERRQPDGSPPASLFLSPGYDQSDPYNFSLSMPASGATDGVLDLVMEIPDYLSESWLQFTEVIPGLTSEPSPRRGRGGGIAPP